jgi:signal peptidase II
MTRLQPRSRLRLTLLIAVVLVVLDQLSKHWALNALSDRPPRPVVWTLQWNLTFNSGMAFSKGQSAGPVIGVIALGVVALVLWGMRKYDSKVVAVAGGLVVGGALGNVVDRLFRDEAWMRGSVVDFIDFQWFPIFNVADMGVNVGAILFALWSLTSAAAAEAPATDAPAGDGDAAGEDEAAAGEDEAAAGDDAAAAPEPEQLAADDADELSQ